MEIPEIDCTHMPQLDQMEKKYRKLFEKEKKQYIENYLNKNLPLFEEKGEFETTLLFEQRKEEYDALTRKLRLAAIAEFEPIGLHLVQDQFEMDRHAQVEEIKNMNACIRFARSVVAYFMSQGSNHMVLNQYNADEEAFSLTWNGYWDSSLITQIHIPISIAPKFKNSFISSGVPVAISRLDPFTGETEFKTVFEGDEYTISLKQSVPQDRSSYLISQEPHTVNI